MCERLVLNPQAGVLAGVSARGDSVTLVPMNPKGLLTAAKPNRVLVLSSTDADFGPFSVVGLGSHPTGPPP